MLGRTTGPQGVTAEGLGLHARATCGPLQNPADRRAMNAAPGEIAVPVDRAEHRSRLQVRCLQPLADGAHRTSRRVVPERNSDLAAAGLLVGLRAAQIDDQSVLAVGDIGDRDGCELRTAKRAGTADQDQRAIARAREVLRATGNDPANVGGEERLLSVLRRADRAADARQRLTHDEVMR